VRSRSSRVSSIVARVLSRNSPRGPANTRPARSSSALGASPTTMRRAVASPSGRIVWAAESRRGQPVKAEIAARSSSRVAAEPAGIGSGVIGVTARRGAVGAWMAGLTSGTGAGASNVVTGRGLARGRRRSRGWSRIASSAPHSICNRSRARASSFEISRGGRI
jgi:hypothetical protein